MKRQLNFLAAALVTATAMYAVDGVTLINQSTILSSGGFPYVISQSGSYKLSGNISGQGSLGVCGVGIPSTFVCTIRITAANVTLDLNGFNITTTLFSNNHAASDAAIVIDGMGARIFNGSISSSNPVYNTGSGLVLESLRVQPAPGDNSGIVANTGSGFMMLNINAPLVSFLSGAAGACPVVIQNAIVSGGAIASSATPCP